MKRILIDCTVLQGRSWDRGIGKYAESLINSLADSDNQHFGYLLSSFSELRPLQDVIKFLMRTDKTQDIHIWPYNSTLSREIMELERESFIKSLSYDEVLVLDLFEARHHIPISVNKFHYVPTSVILHDLIPFEDPATYLTNKHEARIYYEAISDLKKADLILCNSHYSQKSAEGNFAFLAERVRFVGGGPNRFFSQLGVEKKKQIISILGDSPRKNVGNLLTAWSGLPNDILETYKLKIVGNFSSERIDFYLRNLGHGSAARNSIDFTGPIPDSDLQIELNASIALFHPAFSEGLGLPILEAIAVGVPAISSDNTAMKEVAQAGALLKPEDPNNIRLHLEKIIREIAFRDRVMQSQVEVLKNYNWDSVSNKVISFIQERENLNLSIDYVSDKGMAKVAYIAPSISSKTGIARFADFLLPYLRSFTSVDFISTESIVSIDETQSLMRRYDHVFIQLGNSPHHKNAFKLAANFPSVVFCHDIKFGSTLKKLYEEDKEWMPELEVLSQLEGDELDFMGLSRALNLALGVIVQSETATNYLRHIGIPKIKVKKVLHPSLSSYPSKNFRVGGSDNLEKVVSAGFITPNKGYEKLIEAICIYNSDNRASLSLKLIGEAEAGYSKLLFNLAKSKSVRLEITGYLDFPEYLNELSGSQIAVQLRSMDSGEASGVVSDLLSFGIPTIVNDVGTFSDLPDSLVRKVATFANPADIANALNELKLLERRQAYSESAINFTKNSSRPEFWAEEVFNFIQIRYRHDLVQNVRKHAAKVSDKDLSPLLASLEYVQKLEATFGYSFRVGSDVSNLRNTTFITGIQRATLEVHKNLVGIASNDRYLITGVSLSSDLVGKEQSHPQIAMDTVVAGLQGSIDNLDALLLIDLNFHFFKSRSFHQLVQRGRPIIANIYDVLPISNPEWFPYGTDKNLFIPWVDSILEYATDIIVNSEATHVELEKLKLFSRFKGQVHVAPLGISSDFPRVSSERLQFRTLLVGTIEPRKGHEDALNAFDQLHAQGILVELHIVGRQGWMVESLVTRILGHSLYNKKLFWHTECSDTELSHLYATSQVTLITSKGEGFGLPLIEALSQGSKVVARDIPVFREIGQENVFFFDASASNLSDIWIEALNDTRKANQAPIRQKSGYEDYARLIYSILEKRLGPYQ